jgi:hypothetical protein
MMSSSAPVLGDEAATMTPDSGKAPIQVRPVPIDWHSGLSVYASEAFLESVGDAYGWLGGFNGAGRLRCVLPFTVLRKAIFRLVRFRVETIPVDGNLDLAEEKSFLNGVVGHFRSIGADLIIPASTNAVFRTYPDGAVAAPYGTYVINLTQTEDTLWGNLHSKHRNVIRSATKKGVVIQDGVKHLDVAYEMILTTLKRSRLDFTSYVAFRRLVLGLGERVKIMVAFHDGDPQGCAVIPFSGHSAYYVYGGSSPSPVTGAMNLLLWEAIRFFRHLGVKRFDLVGVRISPEPGTKQAGLTMFKERFGGMLTEGYLWKYRLHRLPYLAYSLGVRMLRGGDIVDQEKHKLANGVSTGESQRSTWSVAS